MGIVKRLHELINLPREPRGNLMINGISAEVLAENDEKINTFIKNWGGNVRIALKRSAQSATSKGKRVGVYEYKQFGRTEKKLYRSIRVKFKARDGAIEGIGFSFERHGVFLQKGVGRGYKMAGNTAIRVTQARTTVPRSETDWFNRLISKHGAKLANGLAEINADIVVNATRILIK